MLIPSIWPEYGKFAELRTVAQTTGLLDMRNVDWAYPVTLLPLTGYLLEPKITKLNYTPPANSDVASYVRLMIQNPGGNPPTSKSYLPNNFLPSDRKQADGIVSRVMKLQDDGRRIGGRSAFAYLLGELVANIYEHSEFNKAMVMAQRYSKKGFVEVAFFDDGITIPGSLRKAGFNYSKDLDAIKDAVNGKSSKENYERGYGLNTNVRMCTDVNGLGGRVLVVSGRGAFEYCSEESEQRLYNLRESPYSLNGTLIGVRIPYPAKEVNIYEFTQ